MPVLEPLVVALGQRPRADERHLAAQHVEQLRQLVERPAPQERADARDARVLADLEQRALLLVVLLELVLQRARRPRCIVRNLRQANGLPPMPGRSERNSTGPRESSLIASAISQQQRRRARGAAAPSRRCRSVRLIDEVDPVEHRRLELEQRQRLAGHELDPVHQDLHRRRRHAHAHAVAVAAVHQLDRLVLREVRIGDQHLVDRVEVALERSPASRSRAGPSLERGVSETKPNGSTSRLLAQRVGHGLDVRARAHEHRPAAVAGGAQQARR